MIIRKDIILKKFIFLLLLFVTGSSMESQVPSSESIHRYDGDAYTLRVENSPFQIVAGNHDHDVLKVNGIIADNGTDVAPVLQKGVVSRDVYLPQGTWTDFWSGKVFKGGSVINYPAPLDVLPVFIRIE